MFTFYGVAFFGIAMLHAIGLHYQYGGGCPRTQVEWLGELTVSVEFFASAVLISVGHYLHK